MSADRKILKFRPDVQETRSRIRMTDRVDAVAAQDCYNLPAIVGPGKSESGLVDARGRAYDSDPLSACADVNSFLDRTESMIGMPSFIGYASCANLSQDAMMRAGVETLAAEMTREWIDVNCPNTDWQKAVVEELHTFKIRRLFRKAASMTGYDSDIIRRLRYFARNRDNEGMSSKEQPRGQPDNAGQFASVEGGGNSAPMSLEEKRAAVRDAMEKLANGSLGHKPQVNP